MRVTDLGVRLDPLASIDLHLNVKAVSTFPASVTGRLRACLLGAVQ